MTLKPKNGRLQENLARTLVGPVLLCLLFRRFRGRIGSRPAYPLYYSLSGTLSFFRQSAPGAQPNGSISPASLSNRNTRLIISPIHSWASPLQFNQREAACKRLNG